MGFVVVSEGTLNSSVVHPREVFRGAIVATAASIIIAHNHPSLNPDPSTEDIQITKQLLEASKIIGIALHDHIIFAGDKTKQAPLCCSQCCRATICVHEASL
jgi:DNA repair protein RadC